jgi:uncharacterized HAD superfamily protein
MVKKKLKVGFDLDGVIIDKPFFVPKSIIEYLYRAHNGNHKKYRVPTCQLEILVRKLSHHWAFRLPLKKNLEQVKKIAQQPNIDAYIISGRYNFLENRTKQWFNVHHLNGLFKKVFINMSNDQPHLFKEKMIKKLSLDYFVDDDPVTWRYLVDKIKGVNIKLISNENFDLFDLLPS